MAEYAPGMRIELRDEEWMVQKIEINNLGNKALHCVGISPLIKDKEAIFLTDLEEIKVIDPSETKLVPDTSEFFNRTKLYLESQWRQKIPTDNKLHIGDEAAMDPMPYQLEPAQQALKHPRQRILIADAVGLGKTLEAGILMSELIARGKGKRILVVTAKSMMTQFQKEMWNRFTIPLVRLDSNRIHKIRSQLPSNFNPFFYYDKTIVSIDTLKRDIEYRTHLENAYWDIIVIDEAQNVAERGEHQQRNRLAKLLADRSDTMIMLSATPHDGRARSFASLMNMLDPTAIANPDDYTKDDIKGLCIRRFKQDVKNQVNGTFLERNFELEKCHASMLEEAAYDVFSDMKFQMDENKKTGAGQLFKTSLEKSLFSSPAACIKSINERLNKLKKKYTSEQIKDIDLLEKLKASLEMISPKDFSRYQKLLSLLNDSNYGWTKATDDRVVIFTERIETMKFLVENLRKDLGLSKDAVQEISGGMSDTEQQKIVEDFGREESPIRVLVASDVASEGLNLHYLSHRMIHFDIPWSLMVFQQRNGRIDRYGQKQRPDIRYLMIESDNKKIHGDMRILEILVTKEEQALKNIGDPAMLLGKFNIEDEELVVTETIENGSDENAFESLLGSTEEEFNPFDLLMKQAQDTTERPEVIKDETLFKDIKYLEKAFRFINKKEEHPLNRMENHSGLELKITPDMRRRLAAILPEEVMPQGDYLNLSDDKQFCMEEMMRSMQNSLSETAWPRTQYLWKQHPIFNWVNDKAGLLFGRGEAPLLGINTLNSNEVIFIIAGTIPNRKSTPLVDEWFALEFVDSSFTKKLSMNDMIQKTGIRQDELPNTNSLSEEDVKSATSLLPKAIEEAQKILNGYFEEYNNRMNPMIDEELDKLTELQKRHKDYQRTLFSNDERFKSEAERKIDALFNNFTNWVTDSLTIQNNPYIRVIAVIKGVAK
ncbi:DEAD/DEAH box helicase [uncultured Treponema sp.]|uniref:DEAD/DEAH box helicase n=1 Tax=uncultured Treponema sp. TaxID=162155 RepID=UPI0025979A38|nr:DEAD/DEAH box helicase [uncultured Treponema sp.]